MQIHLDLGSTHEQLNVVVTGRLDVHNAAAFRQLMSSLHRAAGSGLTCDISGAEIADAAGRSAVEGVRHHTEEYGGSLISSLPPEELGADPAGVVPPVPSGAS